MKIKIDVLHVHFASVDDLSAIKTNLGQIVNLGERTMTAFTDYAAKQKGFNDRILQGLSGLEDDIKSLNDKIQQLQTSPGEFTPEDQVLFDELQRQGEAMATAIEALDALTPPALPPAPIN